MTKVLLVEDDKSLREIYGVRLLAEGYDIVSAGDGEEALAMAIKERPQLIVSDVMMPKISGFDMLDILRSTTETKDIKVIMMTALSSEDQRVRGVTLGADRYLVKSQVGIEDVVRTVHEVLADAPVTTPTGTSTFGGSPSPSAAPRVLPSAPSRPTTSAPIAPPAPPKNYPPASQPASDPLPQPTAPFSTTRPTNLGDRIIHPITSPASQMSQPDLGSLIDQELHQGSTPTPSPPAPPTPPVPPSAPVQSATPSALPQQATYPGGSITPVPPVDTPTTPPANTPPDISFEETPRPSPPPAGNSGQPPAS